MITKITHFFRQLLTLIPIFFGFVMFMMFFIIELLSEGFIDRHYIIFGISVAFPLLLGMFLFISTRLNIKEDKLHKLESDIVRYCAYKGGKLTVSEVSMRFQMTLTTSKHTLQTMQSNGFFEMEVSENGAVIYRLADLVTDHQKKHAYAV